MPSTAPQPNPAHATEPSPPDFARGRYIAGRPGPEFASVRRARIGAHGVAGMLFLPIIGLAYLLHLTLVGMVGVPFIPSAVLCVLLGGAGFVLALAHNFRLGDRSGWDAFHKQSNTDTRYRLRAVIPQNRRTQRLSKWALRATGLEQDHYPASAEELAPITGGFEPIILRPWLGVRRDRAYWRTVWLVGTGVVVAIIALGVFRGSLLLMLNSVRLWGYMAIVLIVAFGLAEFLFPVYLRLAPGRLDIFRYGLLGLGRPAVTTFDLRRAGLCVNFGSSMAAVEPAREPGTPLPALVLSKKWPHFQEHPSGHIPEYLCVALCPGRTEFCQRLIQAARTDEPTPPLPDDRLLD
jgi:hypothetical protein